MTHHRKTVAAIGVVAGTAALLMACTSSTTAPDAHAGSPLSATDTHTTTRTSNVAQAPCPTNQLTVALGAREGTAGHIIQAVEFTNSGTIACTLTGYPGISLAGGTPRKQIGAAATRTGEEATPVTLAPGGVAHATVQYSRAENYDPAACGRTPAEYLVVYPPNQTESVALPFSVTACTQPIELLSVHAVHSGA